MVESGIPAEVVAAIAAAVVSLEGAVAVRSIRKAPAGGSRRGVWGDAGVLANTTPLHGLTGKRRHGPSSFGTAPVPLWGRAFFWCAAGRDAETIS